MYVIIDYYNYLKIILLGRYIHLVFKDIIKETLNKHNVFIRESFHI